MIQSLACLICLMGITADAALKVRGRSSQYPEWAGMYCMYIRHVDKMQLLGINHQIFTARVRLLRRKA